MSSPPTTEHLVKLLRADSLDLLVPRYRRDDCLRLCPATPGRRIPTSAKKHRYWQFLCS